MAKRVSKEEAILTKKQVAISRRELQARKRLIIGVVAAAVVVLGVIAAGFIIEFVVKPSSPVATVNGVKISRVQYQKMVKYQRDYLKRYIQSIDTQKASIDPNDQTNSFMIQYYDQMLAQAQQQLTMLGPSTLDELIDDQLIRQGATQEGVTVTDAQIDEEIEKNFGYYRTPPTATPEPTQDPNAAQITPLPTPQPLPTATPVTKESFDKQYAQVLESIKTSVGFSEADYRDLIRASLYRTAMQKIVSDRTPATSEQVWARHILIGIATSTATPEADASAADAKAKETAQMVLDRLKKGEDFAALAKEFSTDTSNKDTGGDLGWFGRGQMVKEFEDVAFSLPVGQISELVKTSFGYHIIQVEGHDQNRAMPADQLSQAQSDAFTKWRADVKQKAAIQRNWTPNDVPVDLTPTPLPLQ